MFNSCDLYMSLRSKWITIWLSVDFYRFSFAKCATFLCLTLKILFLSTKKLRGLLLLSPANTCWFANYVNDIKDLFLLYDFVLFRTIECVYCFGGVSLSSSFRWHQYKLYAVMRFRNDQICPSVAYTSSPPLTIRIYQCWWFANLSVVESSGGHPE